MIYRKRSKSVKNAKKAPCNLSQAKQLNLKSLAMQAGLKFSGCPTQADSHFLSVCGIRLILLLLPFFSFAASVDDFLSQLERERKEELEEIFRYLLVSTEAGYVLYGNKPVCMLTMQQLPFSFAFPECGKTSLYLGKLFELMEEYQLHTKRDWIIKHCDTLKRWDLEVSQVLIINRANFLKTVNEHLCLFQYILGPETTAQKLLERLLRPDEDLFSILNTHFALVGILLGYGAENAIHYYQTHQQQENETAGFITGNLDVKSYPKLPNFGYISGPKTDQILFDLRKARVQIRDVLYGNLLKSVMSKLFDQFPNAKRFQKRVQKPLDEKMVIQALAHQFAELCTISAETFDEDGKKSFLEGFISDTEVPILNCDQVYQKLLALCEAQQAYEHCEDETAKEELKKHYFLLKEKDNFQFGRAVAAQFHGLDIQKIKEAFLEPQDASFSEQDNELLCRFYFSLFKKQKEEQRLEAARYFAHLPSSVQCIAKDRLYVEPLQKGQGAKIAKNSQVTLNCVMQDFLGHRLEEEKIPVDVSTTIRGLSQGLLGQRVGSKLRLYIHPELGYASALTPFNDSFLIIEAEILSKN